MLQDRSSVAMSAAACSSASAAAPCAGASAAPAALPSLTERLTPQLWASALPAAQLLPHLPLALCLGTPPSHC